jgi:hypothetical protein
MTSGSRLEMVDSPRSVGRFHSVWAYSGVFQALSLSLSLCVCSSGLPGSEVNDAQVGFWTGCFVMSCPGSDFHYKKSGDL